MQALKAEDRHEFGTREEQGDITRSVEILVMKPVPMSQEKAKVRRKSVVLNSEAWIQFCEERKKLQSQGKEHLVDDFGDSDEDEEVNVQVCIL